MITQTSSTGPDTSTHKPLQELQHGSSSRPEQIRHLGQFHRNETTYFTAFSTPAPSTCLTCLNRSEFTVLNRSLHGLWHLQPKVSIISTYLIIWLPLLCLFSNDNGGRKGEWKRAGCNIWLVDRLMSAIHICSVSSNSSLFFVNRTNWAANHNDWANKERSTTATQISQTEKSQAAKINSAKVIRMLSFIYTVMLL